MEELVLLATKVGRLVAILCSSWSGESNLGASSVLIWHGNDSATRRGEGLTSRAPPA